MDAKSVRLDVYVRDGKGTIYDNKLPRCKQRGIRPSFAKFAAQQAAGNQTLFFIEMQVADTKELPKRIRYYQSMIDLQMIDRGQSYRKLNPSYVIFICQFDLFDMGRHIYSFENICKEDKDIFLGDGAVRIFLNADGKLDDVSRELKAFLDYVAGKESEDSFVRKLEEAVKAAKKNREWRHEYMTLLMRDQENIEKGKLEGRALEIIETGYEFQIPEKDILERLQKKLNLPLQAAEEYLQEFGKQESGRF